MSLHIHDLSRHKVLVDEKEVTLTYTEFKVLKLLANNRVAFYAISNCQRGTRGRLSGYGSIRDVQIVGLRKNWGT